MKKIYAFCKIPIFFFLNKVQYNLLHVILDKISYKYYILYDIITNYYSYYGQNLILIYYFTTIIYRFYLYYYFLLLLLTTT